jgi:hypothetical protein
VLTTLGLARLLWRYRTHVVPVDRAQAWRLARLTAVAGVFSAVLLSPVLYAVGVRIAQGDFDGQRTFWRSSPRGVDLAAFLLPNPNHPLAPDAIRAWLSPRPDAYFENVASIPLLIGAVLLLAWWHGWRPPRVWSGFALLFVLLALGPFVHVAGVNTYVPGPWALLRYVPLLGMARTPARFSVVVMLMVSVLFAAALCWLTARAPARRRLMLATVGTLLAFELLPAPRLLHSAAVPPVYRHVAAAPADARLLELPFGVRDGTASHGNFTARSQFFQTYHHKPLIGGYLSRVSRRRIAEIRRYEMLDALLTLSEGKTLDAARDARLVAAAPAFVARSRLQLVVIDRQRTPPALADFARRAFGLELVEDGAHFAVFRVRSRPPGRSVPLQPQPAVRAGRRLRRDENGS